MVSSPPVPDAVMTIFTSPDKLTEIRVRVDSEEEFLVPPDHVSNVLEAMQPVSRLRQSSKCEGIAQVSIKSRNGAPLRLTLHTHGGRKFAAHTNGDAQENLMFVGGDAARLRQVLQAAQTTAKQNQP